jgi:hypothetical protein
MVLFHEKVGAFRVIPYFGRKRIELPSNLHELMEISKATLKRIEEMDEAKDEIQKRDFIFEGVKLTEESESDSEESDHDLN